MKKGFEWPIGVLLGLILLIFVVALFYSAITLQNPREPVPQPQQQFCRSDNDCREKTDGEKCLQIYSFETGINPFCGCLKDEDCIGGKICGFENKCE